MGSQLNNLPLQLSSFIGRERETAEVKRLLASARLVTLTGAGGSGKTRLALHAAHELESEYRDGIALVEFAPLTDPALVPQAALNALRVSTQSGRTPTEALLDYLNAKRLLLVLDNCEHLIEACAQLAHTLLQTCPLVKILATSRERLNIEGEVGWIIPSMQAPGLELAPPALPALSRAEVRFIKRDQIQAAEVAKYDAVRLFIARASAVQTDFALTDQNAAVLAQICQRLDGIPLAIELAAANVRVLSVNQIAERLNNVMRFLTESQRTAPPRHQTMRATMDWSHDLLLRNEQTLHRRLSIFAGSFTLDAVEAICPGNDMQGDDVLSLLTHLVDKSLLIKQERDGDARYRLLEPIQQYAREKLVAADEEESFNDSHLAFYLNLAEEAEPKHVGTEQLERLRRLDADHDNLRGAMAWAFITKDFDASLRLVSSLRWYWELRGYWFEAMENFTVALAHTQDTPVSPQVTRLRARAICGQAYLTFEVEGGAAADILLNEAIMLAQSVDDQHSIAEATYLRAEIAYRQGNHTVALEHCTESLALARAGGDTPLIARALSRRGYWAYIRGELDQAHSDVEEAVRLGRALGDLARITLCLGDLGAIAYAEGDYAAARAHLQDSLALARELGQKRAMRIALHRLGQILATEGELTGAQTIYDQVLALSSEMGEGAYMLAHTKGFLLSNLKRGMGDYPAARMLAEESLQMARAGRIPIEEAHSLAALGKLALVQDDYLTARARFEASLLIRQRISNKLDMPAALQDLADLAFCQGDDALARQYCEQALLVSREIGNQTSVSMALRMLGYLNLYQGEVASAAERFREGLLLNRQRQFRLGMIRYLPAIAAYALAQNDAIGAARLLAASDALLAAMHVQLEPADAVACRRSLDSVHARLDQATFNTAWSEGYTLTLERAIKVVEQVTSEPAASPMTSVDSRSPNALTQRELEVLRLLAQSMTDAEIAAKLVISARTVNTHLTAIYSKLGVNSRSAASRYALDHKLL